MKAAFIIFTTHLLIFISYPDTTILGLIYLFISMLISTMFYYLIRSFITIQTHITRFAINFIAYIIMLLSILINYPQSDSLSLLYKIYTGRIPNRLTIYRGFKKLGIDFAFLLRRGKNDTNPF
ncbi:MAG: hypothetical protein ACP5IO_00305 [Elusimicrobiales bacterium]